MFRRCALAVLASGLESDDVRAIFERYKDFEIRLGRQAWGVKLEVKNAPSSAFVDGSMIRGIKEHLFAVLRDIVYIHDAIIGNERFDLNDPASITNAVYHILRNARILDYRGKPDLVVCWGGHSIGSTEYDYTKRVGYEIGLRALSVCTGCGPGAMKGPMKGATIGHAKQRIRDGRYIGMTEPGIIAAEPPNPIVNQLVIMPDIEKRLEAFVRCAHAIVVFPGGAGTAEEILYLLGILTDPANADQPLPIVFTGPPSAAEYFGHIDRFIGATLGADGAEALQDRHRRSGAGRARSAARRGNRARLPSHQERRLQLQLAAADPAGFPAAVRAHARSDGAARPASRAPAARAGRQPASRVLRHRRRQRQGAGHQGDRGARPVRAARRQGIDDPAGRAAVRVRGAEAHEARRRVQAVLSAGRMSKVALKYHFTFPDSRERTFELELDRDTAELSSPTDPNPPAWTELGFHQCTGCPLEKSKVSHCPAAVHLSTVIDGFTDLVSYDKVRVEVETDERAVIATLSAQQALASLMGLIMASSGCPRTAVFRPMARFHLPFSNESETAYRVAAMYLLAQHFIAREGGKADFASGRPRPRVSRRARREPRHGAAPARCDSPGCDRERDRAARRV